MGSPEAWRLEIPPECRIFPLKSNSKRPAISDWQLRATDNPDTIKRWFEGPYEGCNVGVATGQGLMVLDVDVKRGAPGLESLELMELTGLPKSFRVKTPSGGVHIYLSTGKANVPCSVNSLPGFPGIDVRGEGGYVVGPGSVIDGTAYVAL